VPVQGCTLPLPYLHLNGVLQIVELFIVARTYQQPTFRALHRAGTQNTQMFQQYIYVFEKKIRKNQ
jgi:hypothetical protein